MRGVICICLCFGCTYPEKEFSALACAPPPTTAAQRAVISGVVVDARTVVPVSGISLTLLNDAFTPIDGPITSAASGGYGLELPLGGAPFTRAYVEAKGNAGYVPTYLANTRPITGDVDQPFGLVSLENAAGIAKGTLGPTATGFPVGTGTFVLKVHDCNDQAVIGATVKTTPDRRVYYFDGVNPSSTPTSTTAAGVVLVAELPPGDVTVEVSVDEESFHPQIYRAVADAFTQFDITP